MANWHFVVPYDDDAGDWLAGEGYPHPPARPDNRLPTRAEVERAARDLGIAPDAPLVIEPTAAGTALKVRGDILLELRLLRRLSERCGQLWVYPDCSSPAIVVDASSSPESLAEAWLASEYTEDSWRSFHQWTRDA